MPAPSLAILASKTSTTPNSPNVHRPSVRRKHPGDEDLVSPRLIPLDNPKGPANEPPSQNMDILSGSVKQPSKEELDNAVRKAIEEIAALRRHDTTPAVAAAAVPATRKSSLFSNIERYEEDDLDDVFDDLIQTGRGYSSCSDDLSEDQIWDDEEDSTISQAMGCSSSTSSIVETDRASLTHEVLQDHQYECDADARSAYRAHRTQSYAHTMSSPAPYPYISPSPWTSSLSEKAEIHRIREEMLWNYHQYELGEEKRRILRAIQSRSHVHTTASPTPSARPFPSSRSREEETEVHRLRQEMLRNYDQIELEKERMAIRRAIQSQSHVHPTSSPTPSTRPSLPSRSFAEEAFLFHLANMNAKQDQMMAAQRSWPTSEHQQTFNAQQALLKEQQALLDDQKVMIADQQALLADHETLLFDQQTLLADQQGMITSQEAVIRTLEGQQDSNLVIDPPMLAPPPSTNSTRPSTSAPTRVPTPFNIYNSYQVPEKREQHGIDNSGSDPDYKYYNNYWDYDYSNYHDWNYDNHDNYDYNSNYNNNDDDDNYFDCSSSQEPEEEINTTPIDGKYVIIKSKANNANENSSNANNKNNKHPSEKPVIPAPLILATGCFFMLGRFLLHTLVTTSYPNLVSRLCHHLSRRSSPGFQLLWAVLSYGYLTLIRDYLPHVSFYLRVRRARRH
ncbi:hypothetical protein BO82DRAFT_367954 [Aspergillus uvarum CBS 121591]|uniref:Uncharacterized protein n=1 Tax=Aspergillus uvarum CBS 121591 TaxID=1448315 RepID=A0A319BZ80_9EURO|nr:hypothetical protein BO82DRAFT_367954 [Aspergillus uvarum CBS 121591]PYH78055.1 hypothetical protein BO82DRAFT_367954 [Aspergillus uvarum CBS 121591]